MSAWGTIALLYYGLTLASYGLPLIAFRFGKQKRRVPLPGTALPRLIIVAPTRSAPGSIQGLVASLKRQAYPQDRFRVTVIVDPDGPNDPSVALARAAGAEVFLRRNQGVRTKGAGLNEYLDERLRDEPFDGLLVLDIDARADPDFLLRAAAYLRRGSHVIQGAPVSKNARESVVSHLGHAAQSLAHMIQEGRSALGLPAILSGTGMLLSRESLQRLGWRTSTGRHTSDDGELNLRCALLELPVEYAPDLKLRNDIPADARGVRLQRRRWMAAYAELLFPYLGPLLRKGLTGRWRALELLFNVFFLPSSSISFVCGAAATFALGWAWWRGLVGVGWFAATAVLWGLHILYYVVALRALNCALRARDFGRLPQFLWMRAVAVAEGIFLAAHRNPGHKATPASHGDGPL